MTGTAVTVTDGTRPLPVDRHGYGRAKITPAAADAVRVLDLAVEDMLRCRSEADVDAVFDKVAAAWAALNSGLRIDYTPFPDEG